MDTHIHLFHTNDTTLSANVILHSTLQFTKHLHKVNPTEWKINILNVHSKGDSYFLHCSLCVCGIISLNIFQSIYGWWVHAAHLSCTPETEGPPWVKFLLVYFNNLSQRTHCVPAGCLVQCLASNSQGWVSNQSIFCLWLVPWRVFMGEQSLCQPLMSGTPQCQD